MAFQVIGFLLGFQFHAWNPLLCGSLEYNQKVVSYPSKLCHCCTNRYILPIRSELQLLGPSTGWDHFLSFLPGGLQSPSDILKASQHGGGFLASLRLISVCPAAKVHSVFGSRTYCIDIIGNQENCNNLALESSVALSANNSRGHIPWDLQSINHIFWERHCAFP